LYIGTEVFEGVDEPLLPGELPLTGPLPEIVPDAVAAQHRRVQRQKELEMKYFDPETEQWILDEAKEKGIVRPFSSAVCWDTDNEEELEASGESVDTGVTPTYTGATLRLRVK
jgi:hypothetical protein